MNLDELREQIDALDAQIVQALNERAQAAQAIGELKRNAQSPIYVPEREKAVFKKLSECNKGPLSDKAVQSIYREIISAIRALEKPTSVAFLGPKDTFSHMAALRIFGGAADYVPLPSFTDVFTEVERKRIDYGVAPVESSMGGSVSDTLDLFISSNLKIVNEVLLHITQNLMARCPLADIKRVYSKDNALLQCRNWLRANLPNAELIEISSTAEAARRAAEEPHAAAIAAKLAAQTYNLTILAERIEDAPHNYTRFVVVGHQMVKRTGDDKTSILVWVKDKPGALYHLLLPFSRHGINLTRIESRPSQQKAWDYVFFIDLLGHVEDENVKEVLAEVGELARNIKVLGSFPRAELQD
ncbi:MAG TPA: prephenate dehydratase [Candidatus Hydrogenedentes bacterium]|nr:prephenate dehydratase [Candidatus Hydrogenedentota bacterium]